MRIYHVTRTANVQPILTNGFRAGEGQDFADRALFGDVMFQGEEGPFSAVSLDISDEKLSEYEDVQFQDQHPDHKEWIDVPAELLNKYLGTAQVHEDPDAGSSSSSSRD